MTHKPSERSVAVIIPCFNEGATIGTVVRDFRAHLPDAEIYVYDNASTDDTFEIAASAGATVRKEPLKGKGNVVRRMFADVEADIYVLVDGDDTYDAASAPALVECLRANSLDMVSGTRRATNESAFRPGHVLGNRALTWLVAKIFGNRCRDMLSGYRVFSRRFVKSFPALSTGFEIETELTVHALELRAPIADIETPYRDRPAGSASKLRTVRDGVRILQVILHLVKEERPLQFFSAISFALLSIAAVLGWLVLSNYLETGQVLRFPTAILATGIVTISILSLFTGLILDTVTRGRREFKRLQYVATKAEVTSGSSCARCCCN